MRIPHELEDEFSDEASLIARLRKTNYDFARLASRYEKSIATSIASNLKRNRPHTLQSKNSRSSV